MAAYLPSYLFSFTYKADIGTGEWFCSQVDVRTTTDDPYSRMDAANVGNQLPGDFFCCRQHGYADKVCPGHHSPKFIAVYLFHIHV